MALTETIPGMEPGKTGRNVVVGALYMFFVLPFVLLFFPFIAAAIVGTNFKGAAATLEKLPGIAAGGGAVAGVAAFAYALVIWVILAGLGGLSDDTADDGAAPEIDETESPTPSPTPAADGGAETTPTSSPTATLEPTPTAEAAPTPAEDEASYSLSGEGGDVSDSFDTAGGLVVIEFSHDGSSNFIVQLVNENTGEEQYLVNDIGQHNSRVAVNLPSASYRLDVDADGSWSADVRQPRYSEAEVASLPDSASGQHHDFMGPYQFEGTTEVTIRATSEDHVAVWLADVNGQKVELLANDVGPYEQTTLVSQEGYGMIIIESDSGEWEVEIGE